MKKAGKLLGGGGGGRPDMAVGGGSHVSDIEEALSVMVKEAGSVLD
jgi:alanyl-tRNA synthetase